MSYNFFCQAARFRRLCRIYENTRAVRRCVDAG